MIIWALQGHNSAFFKDCYSRYLRIILIMHKIVVLSGGLGNQMFQYAMFLKLRALGYMVKLGISLYNYVKMHNGYELERVFGIREVPNNKQGLHLFWLRLLNRFRPSYLYMVDKLIYDCEYLGRPSKYIWVIGKMSGILKTSIRR